MKYTHFAVYLLLIVAGLLPASRLEAQLLDSNATRVARVQHFLDSVDATIKYETGTVALKEIATLNIPEGYKYIPQDKAMMIIHDLWGNPNRDDIFGMIVKSDFSVSRLDAWAFIVSYSESGFVKDEDADKINYDDLLKQIREDEVEVNKVRVKEGYPTIHLEGWAVTPFYDKNKKILHWAKKLRFSEHDDELTLNYDVRILGRKGILSLNAVGGMNQLEEVNRHIPDILNIAQFKDGNKYSDFNPSIDKVAAYTIGGLIAGKLIAKTGLLLLLLKNIKLIMLAFFGGFAAFRKKIAAFFTRKKKDGDDFVKTTPELMIQDTSTPVNPAEDEHINTPQA